MDGCYQSKDLTITPNWKPNAFIVDDADVKIDSLR
jgi:hypothetical protein